MNKSSETLVGERKGTEYLLRAPIIGLIDTFPSSPLDPDDMFLTLAIGDKNSITVYVAQGELLVANVHHFAVESQYQGRGIGARLLRSCVAELKSMGVKELWSNSVSTPALRLRTRIFGEDILEYYDQDSLQEYGLLPFTLDQALSTNDRIDTQHPNDMFDTLIHHIGVYVDLDRIDTSDWERPSSIEVRA